MVRKLNEGQKKQVAYLKALGLVLAKEKVNITPYLQLFSDDIPSISGQRRPYTRYRFPNQRQWLFVKYLFEGMDKRDAYFKAGYMTVQRSVEQRVKTLLRSKSVQTLINLVISDYALKRKISAQKLLDEALTLYDRCDTVKEQLEVLKFIKDLLPKGFASCTLGTCPMKRKRK